MRLTVHIGTTKTGSTSIQEFLRANRATLLQRGILVPSSLGDTHHIRAVLSSLPFGESPDLAKQNKILTPHDLLEYREHTIKSYLEEIKYSQASKIIITSEHLHSRLENKDAIRTFRENFCATAQETRIILYIRPQLDHATSLYSTMLRHGFTGSLDDFLQSRSTERFKPYFDIEDILNRWMYNFGDANVTVRPYKEITLRKGDVVSDFCCQLGFAVSDDHLVQPKSKNESINSQGQDLLRRFNIAQKLGKNLKFYLEKWGLEQGLEAQKISEIFLNISEPGLTDQGRRWRLVRWVEAHCSGKGAEASLAQAQAFQARFAAGNAAVIARHFPNHPEYLEPRWPRA